VCASIDFGRALNTMQVMSELTRQGSNLALRVESTAGCDNLCTAVNDVTAAASGLNVASNGKIIITSLTEPLTGSETIGPTGGPYTIAEQVASSGGLTSVSSKLGGVGTKVTSLTTAPGLQSGQYLYVTEIFYAFAPLTPIGKLTNAAVGMPSQLYDIAYFQG